MNATAKAFATLYRFRRPDGNEVDVVRVADGLPDDWPYWPEQYRNLYPDVGVLEIIAGVEFVDDRQS